ncbi:WD40 repeat-like protein [Coniochaeta ligniaria NRRL 30616]|uniref:WD40 repeat-like protein n=1 Tax=Coniochaeta ligniaria NRRL 30616 TaxID=1408157 RepID=A0A1J7J9D8_9PEZI|nr:WD40 repeat-like protein [Coniochaeta ligniaria NRRL 30616]
MAKKARQRISYVLELPNSSPGGHRLGVNGLAVDRDNAILYSGGRDGVVCAWDLNLDLTQGHSHGGAKPKPTTRFRTQTHPHTHWINDITLAQNNTALVSASSDLTVKVWRPHSDLKEEPATIGQHADYVKCVATPSQSSDWIASGGLDRKIYLWDLSGKGKTLEIDVSGEEITEKGSVYALSVNPSILGSGGPEGTVRLWDPKTGKSITKFVGHTDNVRSILVNAAGDTVITASSDQTVKVWSVTAGRCMHTLTMHNDSVWSLYSDDPELGVFYSSDRSGLVVKTDARGTLGEWDDGLSVAVAQEHEGVSKVIACGDYIWTATSRSSINRWANVDTSSDIELPEPFRQHRASIITTRSREDSLSSSPPPAPPQPRATNGSAKKEIPAKAILKISHTASWPPNLGESDALSSGLPGRKGSEILPDTSTNVVEPMYDLPEETIEGQFGLVKHKLLNDRRRVLTLDTAGDVLLWDLIKCQPIKSFGKRHLEDVEPEVNKLEAVAPWCSIDISSGNLTVALEPFNCFDAETYADELVMDEQVEFREDQRINVGKWILRYLFAKLIDEEIKRDEAFRQKLNESVERRLAASRSNPPTSISIPPLASSSGWQSYDSPATTPRANGTHYPPVTPGIAIAMATPGVDGMGTPASPLDKRSSQVSRPSVEKEDYFSNAIHSADNQAAKQAQTPATEGPPEPAKTPATENGKEKEKEKEPKEKETKTPGTPFGKKFRMGMSFGSKKLGRSASTTATEKPAVVDEKAEESESSSNHEKEFDDSFLGVIQRIRNEYEKQLSDSPDRHVETKITPSLPSDTPVLKLPSGTKVIIQEETSGGSAELYRGTVETVGADADIIEQRAPLWLGDVLLTNTVPPKDPVKVSFVLYPYGDSLPSIATADGNNRLNANRMLRVKKILAYVAERIDPPADPEHPDPDALKPEEYLELYCNEQLLPITMSLATLRAHVWKGGNDIVLYYKANGRKEIPIPPPPPPPVEHPAQPVAVPSLVSATAAAYAAAA